MKTQTLDRAKAEAFAGHMLNILNNGFLAIGVSIGYRTGLFDMMAKLPPATSAQIAQAAGLQERYVREWLGAMVVGKIVDYDPQTKTYTLSPEHAAFTTTEAETDNMALFTQYVALIGNVEDKVVDCFYKGGGVSYDFYPKFQQLQAEETNVNFDKNLIQNMLPLAPGIVEKLNQGVEVLDVGCGKGHAINVMAKAFPRSRFTGYDFSEEGIAGAKAEAQSWQLENAYFEVKDAATIDEVEKYDLITAFDTIHDQAHPRKVLSSIACALRKDGVFLMEDIAASSHLEENLDNPLAPFLYVASLTHCMTVSLAYGGEGLGTVWGKELALQLLKEAGFNHTDVKQVQGDILHYYYISTL